MILYEPWLTFQFHLGCAGGSAVVASSQRVPQARAPRCELTLFLS